MWLLGGIFLPWQCTTHSTLPHSNCTDASDKTKLIYYYQNTPTHWLFSWEVWRMKHHIFHTMQHFLGVAFFALVFFQLETKFPIYNRNIISPYHVCCCFLLHFLMWLGPVMAEPTQINSCCYKNCNKDYNKGITITVKVKPTNWVDNHV